MSLAQTNGKNVSEDFFRPNVKFGTDGWRGVIGRDFTFQNVNLVSHAAARTFESQSGPIPKIPIGYDHRFLADQFAQESAKVLSLYRFEPLFLAQPVTSPLLSYITWKLKAPFGVMMTASHNPPEYCGFKVKGSFCGSIAQETAGQIEKKLDGILDDLASLPAARSQEIAPYPIDDLLESYFKYLSGHIDVSLFRKPGRKVTFDFLYGPGAGITRAFFKHIKSKIPLNEIHNVRDALFGGLHPEPIEEYLSDLKREVKKSKTVAGFALDGDADRLGMTDENGQYLTPQQVFALILYYLASVKKLKGRVVQAVSLGYLSERIAKDYNLPLLEIPVGFKHVAKEVLKGGVILGGEESGGYTFSQTSAKTVPGSILPERDGLFSALLVFEMVLSTGKTVSQILKEIQKRYGVSAYLRKDIHLKRPIPDKDAFVAKVQSRFPKECVGMKIKEMRTMDGLKIVMEDGSLTLIRPSGTEPLLRTYAEFPSKSLSQKSLDNLSAYLKDSLGE